MDRLRLLGVQGASKVMAGELSRLAGRALDGEALARFRATAPLKLGGAGLGYPFDPELAAVALLYHRTSARVLWDLYETDASRLEPLYETLRDAVAEDERGWLWNGARISVLAFAPRSVAAGERQVVGTVKNALVDGAARRGISLGVDAEHPDVTLHARSHVDQKGVPQLTVSVDLAGRPKHERGYRTRAGEAPLREDVAAYLVMLTRHDARSEALVDPFAGSGTLAVEAASLGRARLAWYSGRRVAAEKLPALGAVLREPRRPLFADTRPWVWAIEKDPRVFALLERSLETAGVGPDVERRCADFRDVDPRRIVAAAEERGLSSGVILCNPPWGHRLGGGGSGSERSGGEHSGGSRSAGERRPGGEHSGGSRRPSESVGDRELDALYRDFGRWCRELGGWRAGILSAYPDFERAFGGRARSVRPVMSGPLRATFYLYDL